MPDTLTKPSSTASSVAPPSSTQEDFLESETGLLAKEFVKDPIERAISGEKQEEDHDIALVKHGRELGKAEDQVLRVGDDDNHFDMLSGKYARKDETTLKTSSLGYEQSVGASGSMYELGLKGNLAGSDTGSRLKGEGNLEVGSAELQGKAKAGIDWSKGNAEVGVEGGAGVYAGKAKGKLEGGWRVPWTNILLSGSVEGEGKAGVGVEGSAGASLDSSGFKTHGYLGTTLGLGGKLGFGFGVGKAEEGGGWFDYGEGQDKGNLWDDVSSWWSGDSQKKKQQPGT